MQYSKMKWTKLLSTNRLFTEQQTNSDVSRSPYIIDVDRLIYSSHFRKLQDKTQVHPLSKSDYVRTRLTHSLEVSRVGRSLGDMVGKEIIKKHNLKGVEKSDFGHIVQAACLAHDIGNPPFGHLGEEAIKTYFKKDSVALKKSKLTEDEISHLTSFDGNSQGFRIITNIAGWKNHGGLRLTYATLGAFLKYPSAFTNDNVSKLFKKTEPYFDLDQDKYPSASLNINNKKLYETIEIDFDSDTANKDKPTKFISNNKIGVLKTEYDNFITIAKDLGLIQYKKDIPIFARHPLAFLTEAADDICYTIADLEDAFFVGLCDFATVERLIAPIARTPIKYGNDINKRIEDLQQEVFYKDMDNRKKVEFLRGKAIDNLINAIVEVFLELEDALLEGKVNIPLLDATIFSNEVKECKSYAKEYIYTSHDKITAEIRGMRAITKVITKLSKVLNDTIDPESEKIIALLEKNMIADKKYIKSLSDNYSKLTLIVDILADFTDRNLIDFYDIISG